MIEIDKSGLDNKIKDTKKELEANIKSSITEVSRFIQSHTISKHMSSKETTETSIRARSGRLRNLVTTKETEIKDGSIMGGIYVPHSKYGAVHFGDEGKSTTIHGNPWLKIPLSNATTKAGLVKGQYLGNIKNKFWIKNGDSPILAISKNGQVIPLFILKRSVTIPVRISPSLILRETEKKINKYIDNAVKKSVDTVNK